MQIAPGLTLNKAVKQASFDYKPVMKSLTEAVAYLHN